MSRTLEAPLSIEESYRDILRTAVQRVGGQYPAARIAGIDQSTLSRAISPGGRATYTTLLRLSRSLTAALSTMNEAERMRVPEPVIAVRDADHELWCRIGALLATEKPALYRTLLDAAAQAVGADALGKLHAVVSAPLPSRHRRRR
jgi:DNA-binding phage protein